MTKNMPIRAVMAVQESGYFRVRMNKSIMDSSSKSNSRSIPVPIPIAARCPAAFNSPFHEILQASLTWGWTTA